MTELTDRQLAWIKNEIGEDAASVEELQLSYATYEPSVRDVAVFYLRRQITRLLASPATFSASGLVSVSYAENIKALERRIAVLLKMDDDPSDDPAGGEEDAEGPSELVQVPLVRSRRR